MCESDYVTVAEAAAFLAVSRGTVYAMFHAGELVGVQIRSCVRVSRESVRQYLMAHRNGVTPENPVARERLRWESYRLKHL